MNITQLRALGEAATPGSIADAAFIAAARTYWSVLLDVVQAASDQAVTWNPEYCNSAEEVRWHAACKKLHSAVAALEEKE